MWYRWKIWRLAWSMNRCQAINDGGVLWNRIGGNLMWKVGDVDYPEFM